MSPVPYKSICITYYSSFSILLKPYHIQSTRTFSPCHIIMLCSTFSIPPLHGHFLSHFPNRILNLAICFTTIPRRSSFLLQSPSHSQARLIYTRNILPCSLSRLSVTVFITYCFCFMPHPVTFSLLFYSS